MSYTQSSSADVKWSVAPLKVSSGQAGLSGSNDYGKHADSGVNPSTPSGVHGWRLSAKSGP